MKLGVMILIAVLTALAGCVSVGQSINDQQVSQLQRGKTTKAQAIAVLGQPLVTTQNDDGSSRLTWYHAESTPNAAMFIPIVGAVAGSSDMHQKTLILEFDKDGILTSYNVSTSNAKVSATGGVQNQ